MTFADYARAERFLSWNKDRYVRNADIQPHWIGKEDRFWYWRMSPAGERKCVVVDARSGKSTSGSICKDEPPATTRESLSPDGKWAAYLKDDDIWVRPTSGGAAFPLTTDGVEHYGYAGSPGYSTHAVSDRRHPNPTPPQVLWSPDSRFLLTHRLDERAVADLFLIQAAPEDGSMRPKLYSYRYAMPGNEHLPMLQPMVFDVAARLKVTLAAEPMPCLVFTLIEKRNTWWSEDSQTLYYLSRDRFSKSVGLHRAAPVTGEMSEVLRETSDTIVQTSSKNPFSFPLVRTLSGGDVVWYSERDGWGHLHYYDAAGALRNRITQGDWVVRDIVRIDEARGWVYFMASGREAGRDPYQQYLYRVRLDGSGIGLLTPEPANHEWAHATPRFSPSGQYFVDSYSRPDLPPIFVLRGADGRLIVRLEQADISLLQQDDYVPVTPFETLAADGKTPIYGNLYRPSTFDRTRRYPVIDSIYPGPQTIRTEKSFTRALFGLYEAQSLAELGFIVVTIDGRGTPHRSKAFRDHAYGRLDKASDLEDHIAGLRQLASRHSYLDLNRVGIDGASAGGYAAAHAILAYPDFYKVAVAAEGNHDQRANVAPWGEIFNGPAQQTDYSLSSNLPLAANLKGKLLLMHGEMDDNVHPALTLKLVDALIRADKDFDLLIIPNGDHAVAASPYFIRRKWDYFVRHLLGAQPPGQYSIQRPQ